ncbi:MAG: LacI family DNA-binding transcriptional regulator [Planctomycetes bacterium]|nr:LacI family DNA-binding transcriptional regulator [Planctomycetota bacterium]
MKPTQVDIAKRAGVDRSVVSRVLSGNMGKTSVRPELAKRIHQAAASLGYTPNLAAQAVRTGKFNTIALLMSTHQERSYIPTALINGLHDKLAEHQMNLLIARIPDERLEDDEYIPQILTSLMADGLIINYTHAVPPRLKKLLKQHHLPVVWINQELDTDAIYPDNRKAAQKLTQHLLAQGHTKVAYLDADTPSSELASSHFSNRSRSEGYVDAMRSGGLGCTEIRPPAHLGHGDTALIDSWLKEYDYTAIISKWIVWVPVILQHFWKEGKDFPSDISLATFSGQQAASFGIDFVTSMVEPDYEMGQKAIGMLLQKIDAPHTPIPSLMLPFEFNQGSSS